MGQNSELTVTATGFEIWQFTTKCSNKSQHSMLTSFTDLHDWLWKLFTAFYTDKSRQSVNIANWCYYRTSLN